MVSSVSTPLKKAKVLAKVLADSRKFGAVSCCSRVSEILQIRRHNKQLDLAFNRAVETFGSLPRSLPRRKPRDESGSWRSKIRLFSSSLHDSILRALPPRSALHRAHFQPIFAAQLFIGVINVQRCRRRGKRGRFRLPETRKSDHRRGLKSSPGEAAWEVSVSAT